MLIIPHTLLMGTPTEAALGTVIGNPCIICSEGTDVADYSPYAAYGDSRTCSDIIDEAKLYESGTEDCGYFELDELSCCFSEPENPCAICPNGVTASGGEDYVPEYDDNTATCADLIAGALNIESGTNACASYDIDKAFCCPPEAEESPTSSPLPVDDTTTSTATPSSTSVAVDPSIIAPSKSPTSSTSELNPALSSGGGSVPGLVGLMLSIVSTLCATVLV